MRLLSYTAGLCHVRTHRRDGGGRGTNRRGGGLRDRPTARSCPRSFVPRPLSITSRAPGLPFRSAPMPPSIRLEKRRVPAVPLAGTGPRFGAGAPAVAPATGGPSGPDLHSRPPQGGVSLPCRPPRPHLKSHDSTFRGLKPENPETSFPKSQGFPEEPGGLRLHAPSGITLRPGGRVDAAEPLALDESKAARPGGLAVVSQEDRHQIHDTHLNRRAGERFAKTVHRSPFTVKDRQAA